jgi:ATP-dependent DNA helicase RecG
LGIVDASAQVVAGATLADFDPLERERLRQAVQPTAATGCCWSWTTRRWTARWASPPGSRMAAPAHAVRPAGDRPRRCAAPAGADARVRLPGAGRSRRCGSTSSVGTRCCKAIEWLETNFRPYNPEDELQVGLFRVPVPKVDLGAFREAVANALIHRDYHRLGAVHVRLEDDALVVSNPGGLVDGVTLANLLTTEPRPRNRALADAMKRIGVVERSGRGVDTIYRGMLKFGRPAPDYSRTDARTWCCACPPSRPTWTSAAWWWRRSASAPPSCRSIP